mmetsp:Transcript_21375/g.59443  ORF Transcript_21375/g.59443 Transcript_21375/m.59443 type:complete len:254 (+) Transcript_21375:556-1317(+)|eukprot:CAMPEP_0172361882 /NCGR_PEP_ID=MMETSP1060-20121228/5643_1 /TAXON_ID=37318 /ORGANISM="Pseudo-nitzschia pungens, Strain cf. cingulata" /LENGTH=253 /DNA_ID=CAMNT_0013084275 /DNA_START=568 /DNA_END=1329 /DNA_ORIENTATION=-
MCSTRLLQRTFPQMLYQILEDSAEAGTDDIIAWDEDGASFHIVKPEAFNDSILPKYTKKRTKFRSFQRQLNIYGFRMTKRPCVVYHHELFQRGDMVSINRIRPTPLKKKTDNGKGKASDVNRRMDGQHQYHVQKILPLSIRSFRKVAEDGKCQSTLLSSVQNIVTKAFGKKGWESPELPNATISAPITPVLSDFFCSSYACDDDNNSIAVVSVCAPSLFVQEQFDLFEDMGEIGDCCDCKCKGSGLCFLQNLE